MRRTSLHKPAVGRGKLATPAEMISRTPTLADWPYPMLRLACDHCPHRGQYHKEILVARFGGDVLMPETFGTLLRNVRARMRQARRAFCRDRMQQGTFAQARLTGRLGWRAR